MAKRLMLFLMIFALLLSVAYAKDTCSICGEVSFQYEVDIYVCLFDVADWVAFQNPNLNFSQKECQVTRWSDDVKKAGKIFFSFENIPSGTYTIIAYQDVNNNGKADHDGEVIGEPWQCFRELDPITCHSSWDHVNFDLKEDMKGIEIHL